jgi:hypothetical protein
MQFLRHSSHIWNALDKSSLLMLLETPPPTLVLVKRQSQARKLSLQRGEGGKANRVRLVGCGGGVGDQLDVLFGKKL